MVGRLISRGLWAIFVLASLEMLMRHVVYPDYRALSNHVFERHPVLGYFNRHDLAIRRLSPNNYDVVNHTNSLGLRGFEKNRERELADIWVGGDSNTFAPGVPTDRTYAHQLRNHGYWAANMASEGHHMANQVLVSRYLAQLGYRPRAIVLGLSMNLALTNYDAYGEFFTRPLSGAEDDKPQPPAGSGVTALARLWANLLSLRTIVPTSLTDIRSRLIVSSATYGWLKEGVTSLPLLRKWTLALGLRQDIALVYTNPLALLRPYREGNPAIDRLRSTADYVARFRKLAHDMFDVPFGVVLFPNYHQMYPETFARYVHHHGLEGEDLDPLRPLDELTAALRARGIPVLDLLPTLKASGVEPLTFPDDGHLNAEAHGVAAAAIAAWLDGPLGIAPRP